MVKVMAWRRQVDTPLSKPVVVWFTDACMRHSTSVDAIRYICFIFTGQKLCDGKPLGGRGRLTLPRVDAMQVSCETTPSAHRRSNSKSKPSWIITRRVPPMNIVRLELPVGVSGNVTWPAKPRSTDHPRTPWPLLSCR